MPLITVEEALQPRKPGKVTNPSRWYEAAYERLRLSFWTTDKGPEVRADYECRLAELQAMKPKRGHQRKLTEAEIAHRVGVLAFSSQNRAWYANVCGRQTNFGTNHPKALARWEALMIEHGHGLSPGPGFFWNGLDQRWEKGEISPKSHKGGATRRREAGYRHLLAEVQRLRVEFANIHVKLNEECRARHANCDVELRARWAEFEARMKDWRRTYRASLAIDEQAMWDANRARIKRRVNQKRKFRVELLQRISRPWKDKATGMWYSWVGAVHRKLVKLGDTQDSATAVWRILKQGLSHGAKILRRDERVQMTLDELLEVDQARVIARLRERGWTVAGRPTAKRPLLDFAPNKQSACQTASCDDDGHLQIDAPVPPVPSL